MKLLSWARKKLHFNHGPDKNQLNAGRLPEITRPSLAYNCNEQTDVQAWASTYSAVHAEVLTIGTLGIGNLLSFNKEEVEDEEDKHEAHEDEDDDFDDNIEYDDEEVEEQVRHDTVHHVSPIALDALSPNRQSMSSNRESVSSNRESVSSIDIQKLQEELQKILYFNLGQDGGHPPSTSKATSTSIKGGKAIPRKKKARKDDNHGYIDDSARERKSHVDNSERGSLRGLLPLHNFLEMPMDTLVASNSKEKGGSSTSKLLTKKHYSILMKSLKSTLLHSSIHTSIKIPSPLFDNLVKSKVKEGMPQHGTTMDKVLGLLQRVTKRGPNGWKRWSTNSNNKNDRTHSCINQDDEEESLNWAIARSYRGSERFINYITNTLAQIDKNDNTIPQICPYDYDDDEPQIFPYDYDDDDDDEPKEGGHMQVKLSISSSLAKECWINTDDEYLVLEL